MKLKLVETKDSMVNSLQRLQLDSIQVEKFSHSLERYLKDVNNVKREEVLKLYLINLLNPIYNPDHVIEPYEDVDCVIKSRGKNSNPLVLFESKVSKKSNEMIQTDNINRKAFYELILYYMLERAKGNLDMRKLVINSEFDIFIFDSSEFEEKFFKNRPFRTQFENWNQGRMVDSARDFFYESIAKPFVMEDDSEILATHLDLRVYKQIEQVVDKLHEIVDLYKLLSPYNLLKLPIRNDSNILNQIFYDELLYIIGLEERKVDDDKHLIVRCIQKNRNIGSLIENTISQIRIRPQFNEQNIIENYGAKEEAREFAIALELCLTWINRILFLKLLEAQLIKFNNGDKRFQFLDIQKVQDFTELSNLFFHILAFKPELRRIPNKENFKNVPFLNSSLFEPTKLEESFGISCLSNNVELPIFKNSILKNDDSQLLTGEMSTLSYLFTFLDAYDFGSSQNGEIIKESKSLINASVLGLIFEKINGYKDGAVFTPGYITMFMARKVIEKTVIEAFQKKYTDWDLEKMDDLENYLTIRSSKKILEYNKVIDDLKICDPAVGSGHFLVSCLNELIALKSRLGILADSSGKIIKNYNIEVENDELIILHNETNEPFNYKVSNTDVPKELQIVQQTLFQEKQKLIENCLFGVDININSVRICQLRLWIELLKCAYYRKGKVGDLETLPSIDINIKCGNSLLSQYTLDQSLSSALKGANLTVKNYKDLVNEYKETRDPLTKRDIEKKIANIKEKFQNIILTHREVEIATKVREATEIKAQKGLSTDDDIRKNDVEELAKINRKIESLKKLQAKEIKGKTFLSAFEWRYEFPEVLDNNGNFGGFDIIITNPPYINKKEVLRTQKEQNNIYETKFPHSAKGQYEVANIFVELAQSLAKPDGNHIFIFPNSFLNTRYANSFRNYLLNTRAIKQIINFGANQIFENVTTYSCIAHFNRTPANSLQYKIFKSGEDIQNGLGDESSYTSIQYSQIEKASSLYGNNSWILFEDQKEYNLFEKCYKSNIRVSDKFNMYKGIDNGNDSLYICKKLEETKDKYRILVPRKKINSNPKIETREFWVEKDFFKPLLMGRNVHHYKKEYADLLVFFPYYANNGEVVAADILEKQFPLTQAYVKNYEKAFKARERGKPEKWREFYSYIYPRNLTLFEGNKLISRMICKDHAFMTLDDESTYHNTQVYGLRLLDGNQEDLYYYLGILNSKLFWWFLKSTGRLLNNDWRAVTKEYTNPFPLPIFTKVGFKHELTKLVKSLLSKDSGEEKRISILHKINHEVYKLYDLDENEIQLVEHSD